MLGVIESILQVATKGLSTSPHHSQTSTQLTANKCDLKIAVD